MLEDIFSQSDCFIVCLVKALLYRFHPLLFQRELLGHGLSGLFMNVLWFQPSQSDDCLKALLTVLQFYYFMFRIL